MAAPIDIIKYPFSLGAALNRSFSSPDIIHSISGDLLNEHVNGWRELPPLTQPPSKRRYKKMHNFAAVKESLIKLGTTIGQSQWSGQKTLVLGGDHTQGIATVKVSALIRLVQTTINGELKVKDKTLITELQSAGDKGNIQKLGTLISQAVQNNTLSKRTMSSFLDTIAVIWLDSHPDYNDRHTSGSGNIHGMSLAACAGHDIGGIENLFGGDVIKLNPKNFYVLCARDIDPAERALMKRDGVHYRPWELTKPGAMRTFKDPENPITLQTELERLLKKLKDKHIIFSMDIDAIHAGLHKSPYGLESVAATGTPMGLRPKDVTRIFSHAAGDEAQDLIRFNEQQDSPAGPTAGDVFEAIQGLMNCPNIIAADLSEVSPAAGNEGEPVAEKERGLTLETSMKVLAAMLGLELKKFVKELDKKIPALERKVSETVRQERSKR